MFFMPQMVSLVVVALVWQVLARRQDWPRQPAGRRRSASASISWLGDPRFALYTVMVVSVWFLMGFYMLIFLGGLQDIPQ